MSAELALAIPGIVDLCLKYSAQSICLPTLTLPPLLPPQPPEFLLFTRQLHAATFDVDDNTFDVLYESLTSQ